jgi:hypothetical protein
MAATYPAAGHVIAAMTEARDEDEMRKRLTAKLRQAPSYVILDNLKNRLDSAALCSALTASVWEDRILGVSNTVRIPIRCAWIGTGNNPSIDKEIARRTLRIRLNAKVDRPFLRTDFRHADLMAWVKEHRAGLVWAALTLGQAWIASGEPASGKRLGMFEDFARVMGGILDVAGIHGFLENQTEFYDSADTENIAWHAFLGEWWKKHSTKEVAASDLFAIAQTELGPQLGEGGEKSQQTKLGLMLSRNRDRVYAMDDDPPFTVRLDWCKTKQRANCWRLMATALAV